MAEREKAAQGYNSRYDLYKMVGGELPRDVFLKASKVCKNPDINLISGSSRLQAKSAAGYSPVPTPEVIAVYDYLSNRDLCQDKGIEFFQDSKEMRAAKRRGTDGEVLREARRINFLTEIDLLMSPVELGF